MWVVYWVVSQVTHLVTVDLRKDNCDSERETVRDRQRGLARELSETRNCS